MDLHRSITFMRKLNVVNLFSAYFYLSGYNIFMYKCQYSYLYVCVYVYIMHKIDPSQDLLLATSDHI